ncbi:PREDICTED: uncharacterized protein LOC105150953 [Acromyrmex echinatior]|uniref:Uncharacterized protein n=1 Tax=Acromyrmex echinatior TaxID=103372 RepID=F4WZF7_ACREC|nr:PREDICTED: uncharacterized protein LOC105150953 [Acromyrmex echinatior]EGI60401.1 hypothetical protein G5I_11379 [Acromyrmex echinatior]
MFTKHIKIAQLLLLYCVVVQSYVIPENRSLTKDGNSFQDLYNINEETERFRITFGINLYSFFWLSYKWSSSISYSNNRERSFNEYPLKDQYSVPVEKRDIDKRIGDQMTPTKIIEHIELITSQLKEFNKILMIKNATKSSQNLTKDTETHLLRFVIMVYQWISDVMVQNILGKLYHKHLLELREKCMPNPEGYTHGQIINPSDIINEIRTIHDKLREESKDLFEKTELSRMTSALLLAINSIVSDLNERLKSEDAVISLNLNINLCEFQFVAYQWALRIRYPNIYKNPVDKNSQPPLEGQSSSPMEKNYNGPTDKNNTADVLEHENKSSTEGIDVSTESVYKSKQIIRYTLEMQLFIFSQITQEWFSYGFLFMHGTLEGRSFNDFQLPLDDQPFSLPLKESGYELEDDEEITIKDFMDNVKLTKRLVNENLKASEKITIGTDKNFFKKLENRTHIKRSTFEKENRIKHLESLRVKYILTIYRWISNIIIFNTIGGTSFSDFFPHLQDCQSMFPMKKMQEQLHEFEIISKEIIHLTKLLQTASKI